MGLAAYRAKRNFNSTVEPRGVRGRRKQAAPSFVVQKHAASHLHYDFRLEIDGTLKSWAVPKGPSLDPRVKRLAVRVEDHPLEYSAFEGTIPAQEYGAGTVIVWDRGTWIAKGDALAGYRKGRLEFELRGEKLKGMWALVRMRGGADTAKQEPWLLIKQRDAYATNGNAADVTLMRPESVKTGRLLDDVAGAPPARRGAPAKRKNPDAPALAKLPSTMQPQLATFVSAVPAEGDWVYEIKFDGYRILARISGSSVTLYSRTGKDWTQRMPDVARALGALKTGSAWVDGEVVVLDSKGRSDFQRLQNAFDDRQGAALTFCMFDLPYADGEDLRDQPLLARKARLQRLLADVKSPHLAFSGHTAGNGAALLAAACKRGLEGLIAKLAGSTYRSTRSRTWLKLKCKQRQEFVVGGYTDPSGSRTGFGALLLGVKEHGSLRYVGKVGTGFDSTRLTALARKLGPLQRAKTPFTNPPRGAEARGVHWLDPSLVAEVSFAQWTEDGVLRQAVFHGLRADKLASDVKTERIATPPPPTGSSRQQSDLEGVRITHPDRVIFPAAAMTKGALAAYYAEAAARILPHLRDRPLSLVRCPDGVGKSCFYQKHALTGVTDVLTVKIQEKDGEGTYMIANSAKALLSLVQMGTVELHTWGAKRQQLERPDRIIFDLDPDPALEWRYVVEAARLVRTVLDELGLRAFLKTTGGKGLHVVVPITRRHTWETTKDFSRAVAEHIAAIVPQRFTANMSKGRRKGKIFIDFHRNERGATAVAAYSVRANPEATVSVPLAWEELGVKLRSTHFTLRNIATRLAAQTDPWHEYWNVKQSLTPAMMRKLAGAARS